MLFLLMLRIVPALATRNMAWAWQSPTLITMAIWICWIRIMARTDYFGTTATGRSTILRSVRASTRLVGARPLFFLTMTAMAFSICISPDM